MERLNNKTNNKKKEMIEALKKSLGIVTKACEIVNIDRKTHYNWYNSDPEYKESVDSIQDIAIDFVESKLYEKFNGIEVQKGDEVYTVPPSDTAIIFYLKTKGKQRGYKEEHTVDNQTTIKVVRE